MATYDNLPVYKDCYDLRLSYELKQLPLNVFASLRQGGKHQQAVDRMGEKLPGIRIWFVYFFLDLIRKTKYE
ncbi:MAG: hypothetical protein LBS20_09260 [Prevotella sp.]|jgi:hypothetical protein|nr:hypothetical protein [Prevotella sp.]